MSTSQILILIGGSLQLVGVGVTANDVRRTREIFREHMAQRRRERAELEAKQNVALAVVLIIWLWIRSQTGRLRLSLQALVGVILLWLRLLRRALRRGRTIRLESRSISTSEVKATLGVNVIPAPPFTLDRSLPFEAQVDQLEEQLRKVVAGQGDLAREMSEQRQAAEAENNRLGSLLGDFAVGGLRLRAWSVGMILVGIALDVIAAFT